MSKQRNKNSTGNDSTANGEPEVKASAATKAADVERMADELVEDRPEPSAHFDPANVPGQQTAPAPGTPVQGLRDDAGNVLTDRHGNPFDPELHLVDKETGKPKLTSRGALRMKARGRPKGGKNARPASSRIGGIPDLTSQPSPAAQAGGKVAANAFFTVAVAVGGDEWRPRVIPEIGKNEPLEIEQSFADFFEAKGIEDIPPGWALVAALGLYSVTRFSEPKTQTRLQLFKAWLKHKFTKKGKSSNGARNDSGNDNKRQNIAGEKPSPFAQDERHSGIGVRSNQ